MLMFLQDRDNYSNYIRIKILLLSSLVGLFLFLPTASSEAKKDVIFMGQATTEPYEIAPGDILSFGINEEPDFEQAHIIVRRDGSATIRPLGEVYVAGMNVQSLSRSLEAKLGNHVCNPKVILNIQQFHPPKIYLFGAVTHPGLYQASRKSEPSGEKLTGDTAITGNEIPKLTLSDVLINAGGVN